MDSACRSVSEKVAVAGHEEDRGAGVGELTDRRGDAGVEGGLEVVVAGPVFEQVAEDEEAGRLARRALEEGEEGCDVGGLVLGQVEVGNEQCRKRRAGGFRHRGGGPARPGRGGSRLRRVARGHDQTTSARSMTTSSLGTSWWKPLEPVLTLRIASTTSMPSVTLPNTQ